jgi:hypothetical protein
MSGVLTRLVGRATGTQVPGLRPRLPALFEGDARSAGFLEVAAESPAPPANAETAEPVSAPSQHRSAAERDPLSQTAHPAPLVPPSKSAGLVEPVDAPPAASPATPAQPPLRSAAQPVDAREARPLAPPSPIASSEVPPAPSPLLPVQPARDLAQRIATLSAGMAPGLPRPVAAEVVAPTEPEITIQIGRMDIRAESPAPRPAQPRASPAASLPSLADYLRGGRG